MEESLESEIEYFIELERLEVEVQQHFKELSLNADLIDDVIYCLKDLLCSDVTVIRHCAVKSLINFGKNRDDVILSLVQPLADIAKIVRQEAIGGLDTLAGIRDVSDLVRRLETMGVLKVNEYTCDADILNEIAERMKRIEKADNKWGKVRNEVMNGTYKTHEMKRKVMLPEDLLSTWILKVEKDDIREYDVDEEDEDEEDSEFGRSIQHESETEQKADKLNVKIATNKITEKELQRRQEEQRKIRKAKKQEDLMKFMAPRLCKKFEEEMGKDLSCLTDSMDDDHPIEIEEKVEESAANQLNQMLALLNRLSETSMQSSTYLFNDQASHNDLPDGNSLNTTNRSARSLHERRKIRQRKILAKRRTDKDLFDTIKQMLLETSLNALRMKRFDLEDQDSKLDVLQDGTLQDLTSLYAVVNKGDKRMAKVARQAFTVVKAINTLLNNARKGINRSEVLDTIAQSKTVRKGLVRTQILNVMVPGIQGERIAQSVDMSSKSANLPPLGMTYGGQCNNQVYKIRSMSSRNGIFTAKEMGTSCFGKMQVNWTTRTPYYDMDFRLLHKQRVKSIKFVDNREMTTKSMNCRRRKDTTILPSLFKRRLSNTTENWRTKMNRIGTRTVIRLPPLSEQSSALSIPESIISSDSHKDPPPPPNTAELCNTTNRIERSPASPQHS